MFRIVNNLFTGSSTGLRYPEFKPFPIFSLTQVKTNSEAEKKRRNSQTTIVKELKGIAGSGKREEGDRDRGIRKLGRP